MDNNYLKTFLMRSRNGFWLHRSLSLLDHLLPKYNFILLKLHTCYVYFLFLKKMKARQTGSYRRRTRLRTDPARHDCTQVSQQV